MQQIPRDASRHWRRLHTTYLTTYTLIGRLQNSIQFTDPSRRDICTEPCGAFFHPALCVMLLLSSSRNFIGGTVHSLHFTATGDHCLLFKQRTSPVVNVATLVRHQHPTYPFAFLLDYAGHHSGATERQPPCPSLSTRSFRNAKDPNFLLSPRQDSTFNSFVYLATTSGKDTRMSSRSS